MSGDAMHSVQVGFEGGNGCAVNKDNFDELPYKGFVVSASSLMISPCTRTRNVAF